MSRGITLGVLGDPLAHARSPDLHRAGLEALGLAGESQALRTTPGELGGRFTELRARGFTGVNLTHPLKSAALVHLDRVSETAALAHSVNTVGFSADGTWGDTTDGPGFVDWLGALGRDVGASRVLLLGGGAAARSIGLALAMARVRALVVSGRRPGIVTSEWRGIPDARIVAWRGEDERAAIDVADVIVNATPLGGETPPLEVAGIPAGALVLDLVYGPEITPWVRAARAAGLEAYDGLGLLVFQARLSLALWTARPVPVDPLAAAVGWPR